MQLCTTYYIFQIVFIIVYLYLICERIDQHLDFS